MPLRGLRRRKLLPFGAPYSPGCHDADAQVLCQCCVTFYKHFSILASAGGRQQRLAACCKRVVIMTYEPLACLSVHHSVGKNSHTWAHVSAICQCVTGPLPRNILFTDPYRYKTQYNYM